MRGVSPVWGEDWADLLWKHSKAALSYSTSTQEKNRGTAWERIVRELDLMSTSKEFEQEQNHSPLFVSLLVALYVYCTFYRNTHSESDTAVLKFELLDENRKCVQLAEELDEEDDSIDAIETTILKYFDENEEYGLADIREVDGKMARAVKNGEAILYDEEFYYISEPLFRKACKPLLSALSTIQIKKSCGMKESFTAMEQKILILRLKKYL